MANAFSLGFSSDFDKAGGGFTQEFTSAFAITSGSEFSLAFGRNG